MTNSYFKNQLQEQKEYVVAIPKESEKTSFDDRWYEEIHFPDFNSNVKNTRIETLQQMRMSEAFEYGLKQERKRRRFLFPIFLTGFFVGFGAAIACMVLWIGGEITTLKGIYYCVISVTVMIYCMRHIWN